MPISRETFVSREIESGVMPRVPIAREQRGRAVIDLSFALLCGVLPSLLDRV